MPMRAFAAVPIAIAVCLATPAFADAAKHVTAAKKAEKKGEWRKALQEWKAAYAAEANAEYLIGIGDANARLGNKAEAKRNYEAYLADPLALPANTEKVHARLAKLDAPEPAGTLALPGAGLTLPGSEPAASAGKTTKAEPLPLPGLDLPAATPAKGATAGEKAAVLALPGLDLPATTSTAKKEPDKVAAASATALVLPLPGAAQSATAPTKTAPAVAKDPGKPPAKVAVATPPPEKAPMAAVTATPMVTHEAQGGPSKVQRTMAYVTAGVAIAALGGGALAFTKANSAHDDLTGGVHSGAQAQQLLSDEQRYKTMSFVGLAGGLVAAGIATALFAF